MGAGRGKSEINWEEVDGQKHGVHSRDKMKHIETSDQLHVTRMMLVWPSERQ